jgi:hypothetical protein
VVRCIGLLVQATFQGPSVVEEYVIGAPNSELTGLRLVVRRTSVGAALFSREDAPNLKICRELEFSIGDAVPLRDSSVRA